MFRPYFENVIDHLFENGRFYKEQPPLKEGAMTLQQTVL